MRIFSRIVFVLLLVAGLGFGSYSVGKYVLSEKLFGSAVAPRDGSGLSGATTVGKPQVRRAPSKNQGVQMQVVPADDAAASNDTPSFSDLQRSTRGRKANSPTPRNNNDKLIRADSLPKVSTRLRGDSSGDDVLSGASETRRERRRKRRRRRRADSSSNQTRTTATTDSNARSGNDSDASSRHQEATSPRSDSSHSRNDSPVPRAENSGGDSPVPQPE